MKKRLFLILSIMLLVVCVSCAQAATTTTIMMYMCGTDIQSDCVTDMSEMMKASYGNDVNIVVLAGGAKKWDDRKLTGGVLNLFTIQNGSMSQVTNWGKASMGKQETLKKFVNYCLDNYRADRTMLVLWDHGGGPASGICFDELFNDDSLTLTELDHAFADLKKQRGDFHLDIVGCDACLMANFEMASLLSPYADYFVASEELEPWLGWYYTNWLNELGRNPDMDNRSLVSSIVSGYQQACEKDNPNDYYTLSAIDLSVVPELITCVNRLSSTLSNQLSTNLSAISRSLSSMYVFGTFDDSGSDTIDLRSFLRLCASYDADTAAAAQEIYQRAVVTNYANQNVPDATGLSIFIPMENSRQMSSVMSGYEVGGLE